MGELPVSLGAICKVICFTSGTIYFPESTIRLNRESVPQGEIWEGESALIIRADVLSLCMIRNNYLYMRLACMNTIKLELGFLFPDFDFGRVYRMFS